MYVGPITPYGYFQHSEKQPGFYDSGHVRVDDKREYKIETTSDRADIATDDLKTRRLHRNSCVSNCSVYVLFVPINIISTQCIPYYNSFYTHGNSIIVFQCKTEIQELTRCLCVNRNSTSAQVSSDAPVKKLPVSSMDECLGFFTPVKLKLELSIWHARWNAIGTKDFNKQQRR